MPLTNHTRNKLGNFGPTRSGKFYQPKPDHATDSRKPDKSKWKFSEGYEFDVFVQCDFSHFYCSKNQCYFGIIDNGKTQLGTKREVLAKFPQTENLSDPWHGYPVTTDRVWNKPCDCMLDVWESMGVIDHTTKRRIERGVL